MEFVRISWVINHMTYYNSSALIGGKFILKKSYTRFAVISTNESTRIIIGHVIYNPAYTYKFHLKTTYKSF